MVRVLAALDTEIRNASGGGRALEHAFRSLHAHEGPVDYETFAASVDAAAGESRDAWLSTHVGTEATSRVLDYRDRSPMTDTPTAAALERDVGVSVPIP